MPARQDQTLQIFLIIFIFAFLVTAVVAYLGWRDTAKPSDESGHGYVRRSRQRADAVGQPSRPNLKDMRSSWVSDRLDDGRPR